MRNKSFARVALVAMLAATLVVVPVTESAKAQSASGSTSLSINFPEVVVLHYWTDLTMSISQDNLLNYVTGSNGSGGGLALNDTGGAGNLDNSFTGDANVTTTVSGGSLSAAQVLIQNAWAVRALTDGTQVQVELTSVPTQLAGTSTNIPVSAFYTSTGGVGTSDTVTFNSPGLLNPEFGDVSFTMNFSSATEAGDYTGSFTIEATVL